MRSPSKLCQPFEFKKSKKKGILLIHGYSDCAAKLRMIGEFLYKKGGYTVKGILLKGHGTNLKDLDIATYQDWLKDAEKGYKELKKECEEVYIVGFSMGALLALYLAALHDVSKIVLISPALILKFKKTKILPVYKHFANYLIHPRSIKKLPEEAKDYGLHRFFAFNQVPVKSIYSLIKLENYVKKLLPKVICPTLIIQPVKDEMINIKSAQVIFDKINSKKKKIIWLKKAMHVCLYGQEKEKINQSIFEFFKKEEVY